MPTSSLRTLLTSTSRRRSLPGAAAARSRERDQICELGAPMVLDPVGQQQHALRLQRLNCSLVVRDQHDRAAV